MAILLSASVMAIEKPTNLRIAHDNSFQCQYTAPGSYYYQAVRHTTGLPCDEVQQMTIDNSDWFFHMVCGKDCVCEAQIRCGKD